MAAPWNIDSWARLDQRVRSRVVRAYSEHAALDEIQSNARNVLRAFSGSFFLVTRFLPAHKRRQVDLIYAAVRYPDEVVDTFPLTSTEKISLLRQWECWYLDALGISDVRSRVVNGVPWILAGFAEVVRQASIPSEHYQAFLDAMRVDAVPRPFASLDELLDQYIYGSAVVVGYFLAHVYGVPEGASMNEAYESARHLAIALQLTNFARDVAEDRRRGRVYIPSDVLDARNAAEGSIFLATAAEKRYEQAQRTLNAFADDTRPAIQACIDVYRMLNRRILCSSGKGEVRHRVPILRKLSALPADKYWRIPLAYLGAL